MTMTVFGFLAAVSLPSAFLKHKIGEFPGFSANWHGLCNSFGIAADGLFGGLTGEPPP